MNLRFRNPLYDEGGIGIDYLNELSEMEPEVADTP